MQRPLADPRLAGYTLEPLAGGWSGETFLAVPDGSSGAGERLVVRYFADARHAAGAAGIQAALIGRVGDLVPVAVVRQAHDGDGALPGLLVTELLPGERGDLVLARLVASSRTAVGRDADRRADDLHALGGVLGGIAGTLASVPMPRVGMFADAALRIEPFHLWLPDWVDTHAPRLAEIGWPDGDVAALHAIAERAAADLGGTSPCLVHSDLNPKNVLVDPVTLEVTGVLDWEFAHAGHPATDLGNLLRFDREPAYVEGILDGYLAVTTTAGAAQGEPGRRRAADLARAADLVALVDLAARRATNPVVDRARGHLRAIARTRNLHAAP